MAPPTCRAVLLGNSIRGAEGQCEGLLRALGFPAHELVRVRRESSVFTLGYWSRLLPASLHLLLHSSGLLPIDAPTRDAAARAAGTDTRPTLVVASGRDTVAAAAEARRRAPESTMVVQVQHPRCDFSAFDLVCIPKHDLPPQGARGGGGGVLATTGALHAVDARALAAGREATAKAIGHLPRPLLAVCLGGPTRRCQYTAGEIRAEVEAAASAIAGGGGGTVLATASRRTPPELVEALRRWMWGDEERYGRAAYPGLLAWADAVVVTADSASMLSEAASLGKPLYIAGMRQTTGKMRRLAESLVERGVARGLCGGGGGGDVEVGWVPGAPLAATQEAAAEVARMVRARGWGLPPGAP